jgi:DNA-binding NarL/FixJ family response regulator
MIKIAIIDDHPLVITSIRHILDNSDDMIIIASYGSGREMLIGLAKEQPEVLLLGIQFQGQPGDELVDIIRSKYPTIKILVLTNVDNVFLRKKHVEKKGANGYILKTTNEEIILKAIRAVYNGEIYLEPALREKLLLANLPVKRTMPVDPVITRQKKIF